MKKICGTLFDTAKAVLASTPALIESYSRFHANPKTVQQLQQNRTFRSVSTTSIKSKMPPSAADLEAVGQFWANQTYFITKLLIDHREKIQAYFPFELTQDAQGQQTISFITLSQLLSNIITATEQKNHPGVQCLIELLTNDCRSPLPYAESNSQDTPTLTITRGNSIQFALEQASVGKRVFILDAANGQRPGARGYEVGTFQEALSAKTDSYLKFLVDFRNVLQDLVQHHTDKVIVPFGEEDLTTDVTEHQARFLRLILFFVKNIMEDENYLNNISFRHTFFTYADGIYFAMQNRVMEMRPKADETGFLKHCRMTSLSVTNTKALFIAEGNSVLFNPTLLKQEQVHVWIMEDAAPDKRQLEGGVDRACTFNATIANSTNPNVAEKMIRESILYAIKAIIQNNVEIILLNAFGCGAFGNDPKIVATIFAEVLAEHAEQLRGKSFYFMDISANMCKVFGSILNERLSEVFCIQHPVFPNNIQFNFQHNKIEGVPDVKMHEVVIVPHNTSKIKLSGMQVNLGYDEQTPGIIFVGGLENKPKTRENLQEAYTIAFQNAQIMQAKIIRVPLLGTGNLGFSVDDSMGALMASLAGIQCSNELMVILHIPDAEKYTAAMDYYRYCAAPNNFSRLSVVHQMEEDYRNRLSC